ncbi:hypothetical protein EZS27_018653 [termite gut metagenome]|uniref:Uncharacterized protein n=1 Tax=termite gut metagenome TaxID=433724 RepID=A0A5J4RH20_9ZZZZ
MKNLCLGINFKRPFRRYIWGGSSHHDFERTGFYVVTLFEYLFTTIF